MMLEDRWAEPKYRPMSTNEMAGKLLEAIEENRRERAQAIAAHKAAEAERQAAEREGEEE